MRRERGSCESDELLTWQVPTCVMEDVEFAVISLAGHAAETLELVAAQSVQALVAGGVLQTDGSAFGDSVIIAVTISVRIIIIIIIPVPISVRIIIIAVTISVRVIIVVIVLF